MRRKARIRPKSLAKCCRYCGRIKEPITQFPMIGKSFAKNLRKAMISLNLEVTDLARMTGLSPNALYDIFEFNQIPTTDTVQRILEKAPISYEELIGIPWYVKETA